MRVYVTRYALTKGIIEAELLERTDKYGIPYLYGMIEGRRGYDSYYLDEDVFTSIEDAKIIAEEMRKKRRKILEKQIEKLDSLRF